MKKFFTTVFFSKSPKSLIIKIALVVSAVAFIFSLITLIRNIVVGSLVFVSVMQLIGTAVIVTICFFMVKIFSGIEEEDDEAYEEEKNKEAGEDEEKPEEKDEEILIDPLEEVDTEPQTDSPNADYDLDLFDE
ncbi:MAG: hypothetical protein IJJ15_09505 [Ruminococcus sp.]|nr:hypothetical protein [Ruminococcus sp.]